MARPSVSQIGKASTQMCQVERRFEAKLECIEWIRALQQLVLYWPCKYLKIAFMSQTLCLTACHGAKFGSYFIHQVSSLDQRTTEVSFTQSFILYIYKSWQSKCPFGSFADILSVPFTRSPYLVLPRGPRSAG